MAAIVIVGQLGLLGPHRAAAAEGDLLAANLPPNVVLLIDSSNSMSEHLATRPYDPRTGYRVLKRCDPVRVGERPPRIGYSECTAGTVYRVRSGSSYSTYAQRIAAVSSASARSALAHAGAWSGSLQGSRVTLYTGNYINYRQGACPSGACFEPKIEIAKRVIQPVLHRMPGLRLGVMTFHRGSNGVRGSRMISPVGAPLTMANTSLEALSATGDAPLGDALYDVGQYYKGAPLTDGTRFATPIQHACQSNFVILITGGAQTGGRRTVAEEATSRLTQDHAPTFSGTQHVTLHTIAFGITATGDSRDDVVAALAQAARNGGGRFYRADTATDLEQSLEDVIRRIAQATFTFAGPVIPAPSTIGETRAYLAPFTSDPLAPFWKGSLQAYRREADGSVPVDDRGVPLGPALVWDAGHALARVSAARRTIYTEIDGTLAPFTKANSAITPELLGVPTRTARDKVIDFLRGVDVNDEDRDRNTTEDREWKLGDIFTSTPVLVTPPRLGLRDPSYQAFKTTHATRTPVLIAGANDGMLHAFRERDGTELWAFVPPHARDGLHTLTAARGEHRFFVDGSPVAADVKTSGIWKTIVVFGQGRGGPMYYALDVTDTTKPRYLWSFTDPKIAEAWSAPSIGRVRLGSVETYVAFFGGGQGARRDGTRGSAFFVVDLASGAKLWEYYNDGSPDDRQHMTLGIPASPTAVDVDHDGYVDRVYVGDVGGQVWKFGVAGLRTSDWTGRRLFTPDAPRINPPTAGRDTRAQPIYGSLALALDTRGNIWVFFGTGDRSRPTSTASNRFYGIKDNTTTANGTVVTERDLVEITRSTATPSQGWYLLLSAGEHVLSAASVFNMTVFFSSFTPATTVACGAGAGMAKLYAVRLESGDAAMDFETGSELGSPSESRARSTTIGSGMAATPIIVVTPPGRAGARTSSLAITVTSTQQILNTRVPSPARLKQVRSWRERMP